MRVPQRGAALKTDSSAPAPSSHSVADASAGAENTIAVARSFARTHPRQVSPDDAEGVPGSSSPW